MWDFVQQQFSVSQNGFSQSWAFWAVVEAVVIIRLLLPKKKGKG